MRKIPSTYTETIIRRWRGRYNKSVLFRQSEM